MYMRTGVLSDTAVECNEFQPIPLAYVGSILKVDDKQRSVLQLRPSKYTQAPPRPSTFNAMAYAVAKSIAPSAPEPIVQAMEAKYDKELQGARKRVTADMLAQREALSEPDIAARALHAPERVNLRSRAYVREVVEEEPSEAESEQEDEVERRDPTERQLTTVHL